MNLTLMNQKYIWTILSPSFLAHEFALKFEGGCAYSMSTESLKKTQMIFLVKSDFWNIMFHYKI